MTLSIIRTASGQFGQPLSPSMPASDERVLDEARQVDRAEQAGSVRRQRLFLLGLVPWIVSQYWTLLRRLIRSMNTTPGSA